MMTRSPLYERQKRYAARFVLQKRGGVPLECGAGKTRTMLELIWQLKRENMIRKAMVVSLPSIVRVTWPQEIKKWGYALKPCLVGREPEAAWKKADLYLVSSAYFSDRTVTRDNGVSTRIRRKLPEDADLIVLDESTEFKNFSSSKFRRMQKYVRNFDRRYALTATLFSESYENIFAQTLLLDDGERLGRTLTEFRNRYMKLVNPKFYKYDIRDENAREEILNQIKDIWHYRDEAPDGDNHCIKDISVVLPEPLRKQYDAFAKDCLLSIGSAVLHADNQGAKRHAMRNLASGTAGTDRGAVAFHAEKLKALRNIIESLHAEPIIILYNYMAERRMLMQLFPDAPILDGSVGPSQRSAIQREWNERKIQVLLANPRVCSKGLNLQFGGRHMCWFSLPDSWETYHQMNKRLDRNGQIDTVIIWRLLTVKTVDEKIAQMLDNKGISNRYVQASLQKPLVSQPEQV